MKMISIYESERNVDAIDSLVNQGLFPNRSEVYRAGALFMLFLEEARSLAGMGGLEQKLYEKDLSRVKEELERGNPKAALEALKQIEVSVRLRGAISPFLGDSNKKNYVVIADGISRYEEALSQYSTLEVDDQQNLREDILRDLEVVLGALNAPVSAETPIGLEQPTVGQPVTLLAQTMGRRPLEISTGQVYHAMSYLGAGQSAGVITSKVQRLSSGKTSRTETVGAR